MKQRKRISLFRANISLPQELMPFVAAQAALPLYAGNLSAYVRALILRDQAQAEPADRKGRK